MKGEEKMEAGEWITVPEMALRDRVTERTVQHRIKTGRYNSQLTREGRRLILWEGESDPVEDIPEPEPITPHHDKLGEVLEAVLEMTRSSQELTMKLLEAERNKTEVEKELIQKSGELERMHLERMNYNTSLQKASDDRKDNETLRAEIAVMRAELTAFRKENAELKNKKKSFWPF